MSYFFTFKISLQTFNKYLQISVFPVVCFLIFSVIIFYFFVMIFYFSVVIFYFFKKSLHFFLHFFTSKTRCRY